MNTAALQTLLARLGFDPGPIDGQVGRRTIAAIQAFQASRGLVADGVVGPKTKAALAAADGGDPDHEDVSGFRVTSACVDLIKAWEGLEDGNKATVNLEPYVDPVGIYTLGWGHAMADERGKWIRTKAASDAWMMRMFGKLAITRDEAKALLAQDINEFLEDLRPVLASRPYLQHELDALVSLSFNIGVRGFSGSSVMTRHVDRTKVTAGQLDFVEIEASCMRGRVSGPTEYAFGAWSKSSGRWLHGLFRRRMCEAMVYRGDPLPSALAVAQKI